MYKSFTGILSILLVFLTACSEESSVIGPVQPEEVKLFPKLTLPFSPDQILNDAPKIVMDIVTDINSLDKYNYYLSLASEKKESISEITYEDNGIVTRIEFIENSSGKFSYRIYLTGNTGGISLDNFLFITGRNFSSEKQKVTIHEDQTSYDYFGFTINSFTTSETKKLSYSKNYLGTEVITYETNNEVSYMEIKNDKSGWLNHYPPEAGEYYSLRITWYEDGSGEWHGYKEDYSIQAYGIWK